MNDPLDLDDLFAEARDSQATPSTALMARILADAAAEQPAAPGLRVAPVVTEGQGGVWAQIGGLFGSFGGMLVGLGTAAVAGLMLGFVQPAPVAALTQALWTGGAAESVDLIPTLPAALTGE